jgi:hypothetical protein
MELGDSHVNLIHRKWSIQPVLLFGHLNRKRRQGEGRRRNVSKGRGNTLPLELLCKMLPSLRMAKGRGQALRGTMQSIAKTGEDSGKKKRYIH